MRKVPIYSTLCALSIGILMTILFCRPASEAEFRPQYTDSVSSELVELDPYDDNVSFGPTIDIARETKINEVIALWNTFLEQSNTPTNDPRRKSLKTYAECLVDVVKYYQVYETDLGGSLPEDNLAHLVMATVIALESSVKPDVISRDGCYTVGLTQLHGAALAGHSRREVLWDPKLQIILGTRWLAHQEEICETDNWVKLLSSYGAKSAYVKGKGCRSLGFAWYRYHKVRSFEKIIRGLD